MVALPVPATQQQSSNKLRVTVFVAVRAPLASPSRVSPTEKQEPLLLPGHSSATTIFGGLGLDVNRSNLERTTIFGVHCGVDVAVVRPGKGA